MAIQHRQAGGRPEEALGPRVVLEARGWRKVYGTGASEVTVLAGVDLAVGEGEMVAIVGPSGAGKSTLLHLLAALDMPTSGTVYFDTKAVEALSDAALADFRSLAVGFVWQRHHLLPDFTAGEHVAMPFILMRAEKGRALEAGDRKSTRLNSS